MKSLKSLLEHQIYAAIEFVTIFRFVLPFVPLPLIWFFDFCLFLQNQHRKKSQYWHHIKSVFKFKLVVSLAVLFYYFFFLFRFIFLLYTLNVAVLFLLSSFFHAVNFEISIIKLNRVFHFLCIPISSILFARITFKYSYMKMKTMKANSLTPDHKLFQ